MSTPIYDAAIAENPTVRAILADVQEVSLSRITEMMSGIVEAADEFAHGMRAFGARARGWSDLSDVIRTREGRQIVQEGLHDVRIWLGEVAP